MERKYPLLGLLLLIVVIASCKKSNTALPKTATGMTLVLTSSEKYQATADNAFSLNLFKNVAASSTDGSNLFMSPLSVSMAIGMTSNGANGATLDGIRKAMDFNMPQNQVNAYYNKLLTDLPKLDPQTTLNIANSIWYRQGFSVLAPFISTDSSYYHAKIQSLDFNDPAAKTTINNWVNDQTKGKIPSIVDDISPDDVMFLINAIYFKSVWKTKFDPSQTHTLSFFTTGNGTVQADFMNGTINGNFYNDDKAKVLELPYANDKYSMVIVMPNGGTLPNLVSGLDSATYQNLIAKLTPATNLVSVPKFKFSYSILLNSALSDLGMSVAFTKEADFTGINPAGNLYISKVQHKAFVAVDESGTEAAAVTSVGVTASSAPEISYTIDHPFIFIIREMNSGLILFAGTVNNPLQAGSQ